MTSIATGRIQPTGAAARAGKWLAAGALMLACAGARADGVADLRAALGRLAAGAPVKATLEIRSWHRNGQGKDAEEDQGSIGMQIEDGPRGLALTYPRELLARVEAEQRARARDANSKTPLLAALREADPGELLSLVSAAPRLARLLERAVFKGERADNVAGKAARLLTFAIPMSTLSERERKYAKKMESTFEIWIGADGTPMASRARQKISGRAFVVVSFESSNSEDCVYTVAGERLLTLRRDVHDAASGAGEASEAKSTSILQLLP